MKAIHSKLAALALSLAATICLVSGGASAAEIPPSLVTPDKVETRIGTLEFKDGAPTRETMEKVYDHLDFQHAFDAFMNTMQGVSIQALHQGFQDAGVKDNEVIVFSRLMDAKSLFLTPNADTVYVMSMLDLSKGPIVMEVPPRLLGGIDDTGITPAMAMRVPGIGSQYLLATLDADKNYFDGSKTYKVALPPNIPEANFWSFTLYDNMTRSELDTSRGYPRAGSQSFPLTCRRGQRRRFDDYLVRPRTARRRGARQLDPDCATQRLVDRPAALQSARTILHNGCSPSLMGNFGGLR